MKSNLKLFIGIIIGIIITGTVVYASGILASDIGYKNGTVKDALDDLYTKANIVNNSECISGSFTCTDCDTVTGQEITNFNPSIFVLYCMEENGNRRMWHYNVSLNSSTLQYYIGNLSDTSSFGVADIGNYIKDDKLKLNNFSNNWNGQQFYYYACK